MRIGIILGYVIAIVGVALIVAGAWDIYLLYTEQTFEITLSDYATPIQNDSRRHCHDAPGQALPRSSRFTCEGAESPPIGDDRAVGRMIGLRQLAYSNVGVLEWAA